MRAIFATSKFGAAAALAFTVLDFSWFTLSMMSRL
jgi:hypothetical protein